MKDSQHYRIRNPDSVRRIGHKVSVMGLTKAKMMIEAVMIEAERDLGLDFVLGGYLIAGAHID